MLTTSICLLLLVIQSISGNMIDQNHEDNEAVDWKKNEFRQSKSESLLMGIAKSLIYGKGGSTSGQNHYCIEQDINKKFTRGFCKLSSITTLSSPCKFFKMAKKFCDLPELLSLSLNMPNVALMLLLRGLIWGLSYLQGTVAGVKGTRNEDGISVATESLMYDAITETDVMLFLGYLVADESDDFECLNRIACEQPARAEDYLRSAEMVWQTSNIFNGLTRPETKYEKMLIGLQEAIENGKMDRDCQYKYKCFDPDTIEDHSNLTKK